MTPNPTQPAQQPGWFKRNWYWVLGGGCLSMLLCCGVFSAGAYFVGKQAIESSGGYLQAVEAATTNAEAKEALGSPVTVGMMKNMNVNSNNGTGTAEFDLAVKGPKASGTLHVKSTTTQGKAEISELVLELDSGKKVDLRAAKAAPPSSPPARADDGQPEDKPAGDEPPAEPQGEAAPTENTK